MNKFKIAIALFLLVSILLTGCGTQEITGKVVQSNTKPIKIGWAGPLSSAEASLGVSNLMGVEVAIDDINKQGGINGRKVVLISENTLDDPKLNMNAYLKLVNIDKVDALMVTNYDGLFSIAPLADSQNFVVMSTVDTSEEIAQMAENVFAVGIYDEGIGFTIADFVKNDMKDDNPVIISIQGAFFEMVTDSIKQKMPVKTIEKYAPETTDFRPILTKLKGKGSKTFIIIGYDEVGLLIKQAKELGIDATFIGVDTVTSEGFLKNAGSAADGMFFTFWEMNNNERAAEVLQKVIAKYGKKPDAEIFTATGYDAMMLTAEAMKSPKPLNQALYEIKDFEGITGTLTMSEDGIVRSIREQMYQNQKGTFVKLD
jgi:branched-chain amino acid transport system substrate-binding protein